MTSDEWRVTNGECFAFQPAPEGPHVTSPVGAEHKKYKLQSTKYGQGVSRGQWQHCQIMKNPLGNIFSFSSNLLPTFGNKFSFFLKMLPGLKLAANSVFSAVEKE
jgi:hypothetical protein